MLLGNSVRSAVRVPRHISNVWMSAVCRRARHAALSAAPRRGLVPCSEALLRARCAEGVEAGDANDALALVKLLAEHLVLRLDRARGHLIRALRVAARARRVVRDGRDKTPFIESSQLLRTATASGERRRETHVAHETARVSERSSRWPTDAAGQIMYAHAPGISQRQPAPTSSLRCTEAWPPLPPSIAIAARTHPRLGWKRHPV